MFRLTLLRHGESVGLERRVLQGHLNLPLTMRGCEQAAELAERWRADGRHFNRILASPLIRAQRTADIVASGLVTGFPIETNAAWIERDFGKGEGVYLDSIDKWYEGKARPTPYEPIYETGESEWQVHQRAGQAVSELLSEYAAGRGESVLVVSHGNVINAALHMIFGMLPAGRSLPVELSLDPAHYADLSYDPVLGRWRLLCFNA